MKKTLLLLLCFTVSIISYSQVLINEFSVSNIDQFLDSFGKGEDWIELYNTSDQDVDISGWHLTDKENKPGKWKIPAGTMIPAKGYMLFLCSGRDAVFGQEFHTNFKLSQTKGSDIVMLTNADEIVQDRSDLNLTLLGHSNCRVEDGAPDWVISTAPSFGSSNNGTNQVIGYTKAPSMSLSAGYYTNTQTIEINNNENNSILRYTLDGSNPKHTSPIYISPIVIDKTTVVKATAFSYDSDILPGKMDFNTYFINEDFTLAVFSVAADSVIDLANGIGEIIPIGSLEYFNVDKEREATSFGSLNRHGQDSWILDHRSLDWISRDEMGYSKAVEAPIFTYSDRDEYQKFMFRNSGDDNYPAIDGEDHEGSAHIRDEYVQALSQLGEMKLDQRASERVILFLNGQYWGVYGMRERPVDHDYTDFYYDQGKYEIQYLSTWETTEIEYGGIKAIIDWENLRNFILDNDMSNSDNYKIAEDSLNMLSLIDYITINQNVVASDWLNFNTGWWRGLNQDGDHKKWGYILWDLDATFDYYINYTGVPDTSPDAKPCDLDIIADQMDYFFGSERTMHGDTARNVDSCNSIINGSSPYPATDSIFQEVILISPECCSGEWDNYCQYTYDFIRDFSSTNNGYRGNVGSHEKIFKKLLNESSEFKQLYYSRYADLMNTVFSCDNMNYVLDSMLNIIEPEMDKQIARWGGTISEWRDNVKELQNFINERCQKLSQGPITCYDDLTDVHSLTVMTEPAGIAEIDLNTLDLENLPWTGEYFEGMENLIKTKLFNDFEDDYVFSHWISKSGNLISPNSTERKASIFLNSADTLIAVYNANTVSTNELSIKYDFEIFPNPASDYLTLAFELDKQEKIKIQLISNTGQVVQDFSNDIGPLNIGSQRIRISLNDKAIANGFYYLNVQISDKREMFKINLIK